MVIDPNSFLNLSFSQEPSKDSSALDTEFLYKILASTENQQDFTTDDFNPIPISSSQQILSDSLLSLSKTSGINRELVQEIVELFKKHAGISSDSEQPCSSWQQNDKQALEDFQNQKFSSAEKELRNAIRSHQKYVTENLNVFQQHSALVASRKTFLCLDLVFWYMQENPSLKNKITKLMNDSFLNAHALELKAFYVYRSTGYLDTAIKAVQQSLKLGKEDSDPSNEIANKRRETFLNDLKQLKSKKETERTPSTPKRKAAHDTDLSSPTKSQKIDTSPV